MCWFAVTTEPEGKKSVYPSGAARAASAAPRPPPAPPRFSITTVWPQICDSFSPTRRAEMSVAPPGGNGTMKRTGFCGQDCAWAPAASSAPSMNAMIFFMGVLLRGILQRQPDGKGERTRGRGEALLPVAPRQELEREHAQAAAEMRGQRHHDQPFAELHQRLLGPLQEVFELQRVAQRPEMERQEQRERDPGHAVHDERPIRGVLPHANTPSTARMPVQPRNAANSSSAKSRERPRQPSHSLSTLRRPIGACTVTASTNSE